VYSARAIAAMTVMTDFVAAARKAAHVRARDRRGAQQPRRGCCREAMPRTESANQSHIFSACHERRGRSPAGYRNPSRPACNGGISPQTSLSSSAYHRYAFVLLPRLRRNTAINRPVSPRKTDFSQNTGIILSAYWWYVLEICRSSGENPLLWTGSGWVPIP
jgi:hypothetical protein